MSEKLNVKELIEILQNNYKPEEDIESVYIDFKDKNISIDTEEKFDCIVSDMVENVYLKHDDENPLYADIYQKLHNLRNIMNDNYDEFLNDWYINIHGSYRFEDEKYTRTGKVMEIFIENGTVNITKPIYKKKTKNEIIKKFKVQWRKKL